MSAPIVHSIPTHKNDIQRWEPSPFPGIFLAALDTLAGAVDP